MQSQLWPKLVGETRTPDTFPWRMLLWFVPGVLAAALLSAIFGYFELRAAKQIVYINRDGQFATVRADGGQARTLQFTGLADTDFDTPHWSPDGRTVAAITNHPTYHLALVQPAAATATPVDTKGRRLLLASQPWSPDSGYLALLDVAGRNVALQIMNVGQVNMTAVDLAVNPRQPLEWHPTRNDLLVTAYTAEQTPTLQIVAPDGQLRPFEPQDDQGRRFGGVWSPDGGRVAYLTGIEGRGSIWTANADGGGAKQLVADALHSELVWSPAGDQLFFTRLLTETQGYDLYRVKADGSQPPVRVGPSRIPSPESAAAWRNHIAWSPNGLLMLFQGSDQQGRVTVYVALADGSDPRIVIESLPDDTAAFWSPTNRGILVATGQAMKLYWVDSERNPLTFPSGRTPSWQP